MEEEAVFDKIVYKEVLELIGHQQGLTDVVIHATSGSAKGDNYLGRIYRVRVRGMKFGRQVELNLILKTSTDAVKRETLPTQEAYKRENLAYRTILKELENLQEREHVDPKYNFPFVRCYHASDDFMEEMLVCEDLKIKGFIMADRLKSVDYEHCALTMSSLAKLHALSYVMQKIQPEKFTELTSQCPDILCHGPFGKAVEPFCTEMAEMFVSVIRKEKIKAKIERYGNNINSNMKKLTLPNSFSVIGHGDSWINNMLFKYKNGLPVDIRLIDYQLLRYGSPILDILYFIFGCTDRDFRSQHYTEMLDIYHSTLTASLKAYSLDVNDYFSEEDFHNEIIKYSGFGLGMSILTLRSFIADSDDATDLEASLAVGENRTKARLPKGDGYDRYVKRANDLAEDFEEYGYLD